MIFDAHNPSDSIEKNSLEKEKVVIIIPTHNEASVIQTTVEQVFTSVELIERYDIHILIFDSASTDNTQQIVASLQKNYSKLHLQNEPTKSGLGSAYLQAMNYALVALNADIIFEFDADLSHQPKYIRPMLDMLQTCDCVLGSRYVEGGSIPKNWELHRKLFSILGNYIARAILTPKYKDFTSGFRATRRQQLIKILPQQFLTNHYAYKMQLLWLLHKNKAKIREYPIDFIDRNTGYSKLPKNSIVDSLRVVFTLRYQEIKRYLKMCLVGSLGIFVQFITYNVLREYFQFSPFDASQIAVCTAIINNFILNNRLTFGVKHKLSWSLKIKRLSLFALYSVFIINLQSYWLRLGVLCFGSGPLRENIIMGIGIGLISLLNYYTYSRHIWAEKLVPS
ncbi:glycosyltransferase family 2 protein [Legionella anisa]|uniref:Glycosyltransferase family 2 protein n=1 Tax=Legionella anisa TaxID=28082 RepID=A0AAX0WWQ0_9GAMM|nr:glycosyltransferase family 2 protein [Legionella anisa]AWN73635.1 glycosyltransferase family 2 protein [Legionella anisa]KTC75751.1 glycosyltransferase [Legionella anisa]MBN5935611.1 glycosyltransferase family 2 protein [Legionella anisa]MCW8426528.1 glycosyltransferase family 2 protein [Legionella anisa]MCW8448191.1 glycosyltransferase family 2 protein [Legionella anisa]